MARKYPGIVIRDDWAALMVRLTPEQAGELIQGLCQYKLGQEVKTPSEDLLGATLEAWIPRLQADLDEYDARCAQNAENARRRWDREATASEPMQTDETTDENSMQTHATVYDGMQTDASITKVTNITNITELTSVEESNKSESESVVLSLAPAREAISLDRWAELFEKIWEIYPRHEKKERARQEWLVLTPSWELYQAIWKSVIEHSFTEEWRRSNGRYVLLFSRFLREKLWEEKVIVPDHLMPEYIKTSLLPPEDDVMPEWEAIMAADTG